MRYRLFPPLGRELSVLVLGTDVFDRLPEEQCFELMDAWIDLGGNAIDTAREYGPAEDVVGRWLAARGRAGEVTVVTKGAHPDESWASRMTPEAIDADLHESLARLGLEAIDVYLLHRDDPSVPVEVILEAVNEQKRAGRIRVLGASNWTPARLEEAETYAAADGLESFACSSPGLSLAVPNEPPWPDCVGANDPESRACYARRQLPVIAWSSQSGGYFAGVRSERLLEVYGSEENAERLRRAEELARAKGCTTNQLALAWVLVQAFPVWAVIGPHTVEELRSSVAALDVELSADEARRLNLEAGE